MISIPPHILLIGIFIAWLGLVLIWSRYVHGVAEQRREHATAQGEIPPDVKSVSNYERADIIERVHRGMQITPSERWIGRGLCFAVPTMVLILSIT